MSFGLCLLKLVPPLAPHGKRIMQFRHLFACKSLGEKSPSFTRRVVELSLAFSRYLCGELRPA